jgi:hypothetical protein
MSKTIKLNELEYNVENYNPPAGKLLIRPYVERTREVETIELDDEKNEGKDPLKDEMETKKVKSEAPYDIQLAEVVASGDSSYEVGETIVYSIKFIKEFDLFEGTYLMSNYDVYGKYKL